MAKNKLEETLNEANDELGLALSTIGTHAKENNKKAEEKEVAVKTQKLVNFRISEGLYDDYKKFFGARGISLSRAIRMWLDYGVNEVKSGHLEISEAGIRENALNKL
ncbi:MAG: hypothetical protein PUJ82_01040 [Spirochaetales bacterium]|nr:hypothetical protein [Spirochaetales bacterium]